MSRGHSLCTVIVVIFLAVLGSGASTNAQESQTTSKHPQHEDRWILSFGFFLPGFNTNALVSSPTHDGSAIDLEDDLGFKAHDSVYRFDGLFRITNRHQVGFCWYNINRNSSKTIDRDIVWDDYLFNVGETLQGYFDLNLFKVRYRYMILRRSALKFGIGGGISYMDFNVGLSGQGWISSGESQIPIDAHWRQHVALPVPSVGADLRWMILDNLFLIGDIQYVRGSYDDQEARHSDLNISLNWFPWRHVGFGLMYNAFKLTYQDHGHYFKGRFDYSYRGPIIALNLTF